VLHNPKNNLKKLFGLGFLFGLIFQGYFHSWILQLQAFVPLITAVSIWLAFSLYLAFFYAFFALCYGYLYQKTKIIWLFPFLWIIFEWLRSFGPLANTAGSLGFSLTGWPFLLQLASLGGVYLLSFYLVSFNILIYATLCHIRSVGKSLIILSLFTVLILLPCGYNFWLNHQNFNHHNLKVYQVAIIQGNHSQLNKLSFDYTQKIRNDYLSLSQLALIDYPKPDLVFWPETVVPELNLQNTGFTAKIANLAISKNTNIIFGTPIAEDGKYYNAVAFFTPTGQISTCYKKQKLMPFGEYIPLRSLWIKLDPHIIGADYSPAPQTNPVTKIMPDLPLGGGICLESIYPQHYRAQTRQGAKLLYVVANNAWFFQSAAAAEHLQMSTLRAVENNRYLVQAANTGISAIIDNHGQIITKTNLNEQKIIAAPVLINLPNSLYYKFGESLIYLSFLVIIFYCIYRHFKRNK
jgi:apolipoprotein N-acyltransferase